MTSVSVVGLGKLGQGLAACFAARGFKTLGIDIDRTVVDSINRGFATVVEPQLQEFITAAGGRLKASLDFEEAVQATDLTCVLVPTPSNPDGAFSSNSVEAALEPLAHALRKSRKSYHLFVVNSTVMPGTTERSFMPLIEEVSGRKPNDGFGICYCPETVALGSVIRGFLHPDCVIIGESDHRAGERSARAYRQLCENNPPLFRMPLVNAEIAKLSLNCYVTLKISFANSLANLCERVPGANVDQITQALGADRRISPYYLQGGLSYGGPCFPRDTRAFIAFAEQHGVEAGLIRAVEKTNRFQDEHLARLVLQHLRSNGGRTVSVLGLAFKANTPVIQESPAIRLIEVLLGSGVEVIAYDPLAVEPTRAIFGDRIRYARSVRECLQEGHVCVITTQAQEFRDVSCCLDLSHPVTIIDCWRTVDPASLNGGIQYVALGVSPDFARCPESQVVPVATAKALSEPAL